MSRSKKKTPVRSITCLGTKAGLQKKWKKECNKKLRRTEDLQGLSNCKARSLGGNIHESPSDGKVRDNDPKTHRK